MKRHLSTLTLAGMFLAAAGISQATIIGFANSAGNNSKVSSVLGSRATADAPGFTVSNGATPNIVVDLVNPNWDYHHGGAFDVIENHTMGGAYDTDGTDPDIAQVEHNGAPIIFSADPGYALVLNSFDFGLTRETMGQGNNWTISLIDSSSDVVWSESISLLNTGSGDVRTIAPNFVGANGATYTLKFDMTSELDGQTFGVGRNALDNLSFNQVAVPEPSTVAIAGLGLVGLAIAARRRVA